MTDQPESLQLREIAVDRKRRRVLDGVSLSVSRGQVAVAVGPHHCGKTTLLEAVLEIVPRSAGELLLDGHAVRSLAQRMDAFNYLSADAEPVLEARVGSLLDASRAVMQAPAELARECERRLNLSALRGRPASSLTGGERQRLLLFGTLLSRKPFWLLDDPLGSFDPEERRELAPLLLDAARRGAGILLTASELLGMESLAEQLVLLDGGRVVAHGTAGLLRAQSGLPASASLDQVCVALMRAPLDAPPAQLLA